MYFVYVDESGTKDPKVKGVDKNGNTIEKDRLYVLLGISLFETRWFQFESFINKTKMKHMQRIHRDEGCRLELADTEVKSRWIRVPNERALHPFLSRLSDNEMEQLVDCFLAQPAYHAMRIFAVVVDKRYLRDHMTEEQLHRKAYELLIERVEWFLKTEHPKHKALMIVDNTSKQMNRSLAMKHSYFQREGTSSGSLIPHIVELPMFVESNLSNGVQLADLCAYNVYRAFRDEDLDYAFFKRISPCIYRAVHRESEAVEGLKVFPNDSPLVEIARQWGLRNRIPTNE